MPLNPEDEQEVNAWELRKPGPLLVKCSTCRVQYGLIVEISASDEQIDQYKRDVLTAIDRDCPNHSRRIKIG